jgi:hypothetical protein
MKITASVLGIVLVAGFAVAAYKMNDRAPAPVPEIDAGDYFRHVSSDRGSDSRP